MQLKKKKDNGQGPFCATCAHYKPLDKIVGRCMKEPWFYQFTRVDFHRCYHYVEGKYLEKKEVKNPLVKPDEI